jgi:hypothetical protein
MHYDVFNGDADGIIALIQMRLAEPKQSTLITGVKRDIQLLKQVVNHDDVASVTVLDISLEKNSDALASLLQRDIPVFYCDHHRTGEVPVHANFEALFDLQPNTCTSLLINQWLNGQHAAWAVAGAYGDNLFESAEQLADEILLTRDQRDFLKELGTLINYNGYGADISDLHFPPAELYKKLLKYPCPFELQEDENSPYYLLKQGYDSDYTNVVALNAELDTPIARVFTLPCEAWARRISGVFGNQLANQAPDQAHAVLTTNQNGTDYTVSVRAPLANKQGADDVCSQFPTGGGRKAAAGINQ